MSAKPLLSGFAEECGVGDAGSAGGDRNRPRGCGQSIELRRGSGAASGDNIAVRERPSGTDIVKSYGNPRNRVPEIIRHLHDESLRQLRTSSSGLAIARDDNNIRRRDRVSEGTGWEVG